MQLAMQMDRNELVSLIMEKTGYANKAYVDVAVGLFEIYSLFEPEESDAGLDKHLKEMQLSIKEMQDTSNGEFLWIMQQIFYYHCCSTTVMRAAETLMQLDVMRLCDVKYIQFYRTFASQHGQVFHA